MEKQMKIAVKTFTRLLNATSEDIERGYEMDSAYDCGEFCGGHYADYYEREYNRITQLVASKFNVNPVDLELAIQEEIYSYTGHLFESKAKSNSSIAA